VRDDPIRIKGSADLQMGVLSKEVMSEVEDRLRILLDLYAWRRVISSAESVSRIRRQDLVTAHGGVLVFLQPFAEAVEVGCYCSICLGNLFAEGLSPAKINHGGDDRKFNQ
jgi:hypothetical protein